MYSFDIAPGARLVHSEFGKKSDVTKKAHLCLFQPVSIAQGATLRDLLTLVLENSSLRTIYANYPLKEFKKLVSSKKSTKSTESVPEFEQVHTLLVRREVRFDTHLQQVAPGSGLKLIGLSPVLTQDHTLVDGERYSAGACIEWSLSLTPWANLLDLPLVWDSQASVHEADVHARSYGTVIRTFKPQAPMLGELLAGVLEGLCVYGGPDEQEQALKKVQAALAEVRQLDDLHGEGGSLVPVAGSEATSSVLTYDVFEALGIASNLPNLFETFVPFSLYSVERCLRHLDDDVNAKAELEAEFGVHLRLRPEYADLSARELRRKAGR